jgi:hypothetical protein
MPGFCETTALRLLRSAGQAVVLEQLWCRSPGLAWHFADEPVEHLLKCALASRIVEARALFGRQERVNIREKAAALRLFEHAFFGFPLQDRFLLHIFDEHVDCSLRVELREDFQRMCEVDQIAPLVALKQRANFGCQELFRRKGRDIGRAGEPWAIDLESKRLE